MSRLEMAQTPTPFRKLLSRRGPDSLLSALRDASSLDLQILGRTLLHAAVVGLGAGLIGAAFFAALQLLEWLLLEKMGGYVSVHAGGDTFLNLHHDGGTFRPWVVILLPALGGLLCGLLTRLAPETAGGGGDAMIEAFHQQGGKVRKRVLWVKPFASIATLGTGGSGGREGPTMQIGAALGSWVADLLRVPERERRVLMVAGVGAGLSAVFRTPLGAALLAVEVLYRDDFESEALIPSVLASVISYAVVTSLYGESTLFATAAHYPFHPGHLLLYGLMAVFVALIASGFVSLLRVVQRLTSGLGVPAWVRPALGALALGLLYWPVTVGLGELASFPREGLGILGSGYGLVQTALTPLASMPQGWAFARMLIALCLLKLVAASLTIGSGGSAGDFAPSLVIGGLAGGAFGKVMQMLLGDPAIDPGAFALVGMGAFYGGIAHVPLSALVLVSELAGSYDLLVPLMLAIGISYVALRNRSLYRSQPRNKRETTRDRHSRAIDVLQGQEVATRMEPVGGSLTFTADEAAGEAIRRAGASNGQEVFPVLGEAGQVVGMLTRETLKAVSADPPAATSRVRDLMRPAVTVHRGDTLRTAVALLLEEGLPEVPVTDDDGRLVGFIDVAGISQSYLDATEEPSSETTLG